MPCSTWRKYGTKISVFTPKASIIIAPDKAKCDAYRKAHKIKAPQQPKSDKHEKSDKPVAKPPAAKPEAGAAPAEAPTTILAALPAPEIVSSPTQQQQTA